MQVSDSAALFRTAVAPGQDITVRVPATSANLGPGFDSLGLAVGLYDTVRVRTHAEPGTTVRITGEGSLTLPTDDTHLVVRTIRNTVEAAGFSVEGLALDAENVIPHGRGLGSSASAIVCGVLAGDALLPLEHRLGAAGLLDVCSRLEGHPDNVAPALAGGLAISWEEAGTFRSVAAPVHPDIIPVAAVPANELSTESARGLLPATVPHPAAAANAGRAALLIHALASAPALLPEATVDFLHQDYRAPAMQASAALMAHLRGHGLAAVISGAGPTVMALANGADEAWQAERLISEHLAAAGTAQFWRVLRLSVDRDGVRVEGHQR